MTTCIFPQKTEKRKKVKVAKIDEETESQEVLQSYQNNAYDGSSYSARNINPEYLSKYNNGVGEEVIEEKNEEYFPEDYNDNQFDDNDRYYDNAPIVNNYYNSGFPGCSYNRYGSFYGRPRFNFGLGYSSGFYFGSGLSFSFGYGSPGYYGSYYDPFYDPFFSPFSYRARYYDPFYGGYYGSFYRPSYYGPRYSYYSAYNRGFSNGYYVNGGEVIRTRGGREVVRGARSNRSARSATLADGGSRSSRSRSTLGESSSVTTTRGRTRVSSTDISRSQNELNRGRTRTTNSGAVRSRNAVTNSRSRTSGTNNQSTYTNRSRSSSGSTYSRQRNSSGTSSTRSREE